MTKDKKVKKSGKKENNIKQDALEKEERVIKGSIEEEKITAGAAIYEFVMN